jgi:hypothetical protein
MGTSLLDALASKTVKSSSLSLKSIHNIHGRHSLTPGMLSVRNGITDHILQKDLQHTASFFIDQPADTLHTASPRQTPDGRLRDALNVIAEHLPVTLGTALAQTLASLPTARHDYKALKKQNENESSAHNCAESSSGE